jgi:Cu+-exporting ATPase
MRCDNCAAGIRKRLTALDGVLDARVSYALEDARVRFDPSRVGAADFEQAVAEAGYSARLDAVSATTKQAGEDERTEALARELADRRRRMIVGLVASLGVMGLGMGPGMLGLPMLPGGEILAALLAGVVLVWVGSEFHLGAVRAARSGTTNMDTLVSLGASVAFVYSLAVLVLGLEGRLDRARFPVYFESSAMIVTLVMVGKLLESRGKRVASGAVRALLETRPEHAWVERDGEIVQVSSSEVRPGERVHVRPGERIPVDGVIEEGPTHVDESMLTGESQPVARGEGDPVYAGTINREGAFACTVRAVGEATLLADIARLVREAQATRAPIQSLVDRIAAVFVPMMIGIALLVGLAWWGFAAARFLPDLDPRAAGVVFAASTLLISCPCAMGLATPLALVAGSGVGAERGLLFKSAASLEAMGTLDTIVLDKTGTLTLGRPTVVSATLARAFPEEEVLAWVAAVERRSEHPVARALVAHAEAQDTPRRSATSVAADAGRGIDGEVDGHRLAIGSAAHLADAGVPTADFADALARAEADGHTSVFVAADGRTVAHFAIGDAPDPSAAETLARLRGLGLGLAMLTGDAEAHAAAIAARLGLRREEVIAGLLPGDKAERVRARREQGQRVAMVGDGLNDGPALASADVGIAIGSGTDVAIEAADVVLVREDLGALADAVVLSRRTLRTIRQNLFWAFGYNVAAIPLAAGLFVPWGGEAMRLSPAVAALAMALSSLFVVTNSARLRRFDPRA